MSSPLGLIPKSNFKKNKATVQYNRIGRKWEGETNIAYEESLYGNDSVAYFPIKSNDNDNQISKEISEVNKNPHTNDIYDVTTQAIVDWSTAQQPGIKLKAADFAYLRYLGVYPNNRLIVCRKFGNPIGNDLSAKGGTSPVSTIVTWRPPGEDFFDISFGEKWIDAETDFKEILENIQKKITGGAGLGDAIAGGGILPLPGFTEIWQRQVMQEIGILDKEGADIIPAGNPNLIKEAKQRYLVDDGKGGSGLECKISVKVVAEYEQKFIGGLDPTKAFYDIIGNIAKFGTQNSLFYLNGGGAASDKAKKFLADLKKNPREAIVSLLQATIEAIKKLKDTILNALGLGPEKSDDEKEAEEEAKKSGDAGSNIFTTLMDTLLKAISGMVKRFEIRILGVLNALTGQASGTYHVTIGNPKRPLFCSGDMIVSEVNIKFGEVLAFNDLPSRITAEFTMTNARALGLQEIMERFAQGQGRSYKAGPSSWVEVSTGNSFENSTDLVVLNGTQSTPSPETPIGGTPDSGSAVDGTATTGATQSNQTFAQGQGQESTTGKEVDPEKVKNVNSITEPNTPVVNDVKPDPTIPVQQQGTSTSNTGGTPDLGKIGEAKALTDNQISKGSDELLSAREGLIDNQLKNTPETVKDIKIIKTTNQFGTGSSTTVTSNTIPNKKYNDLLEEKKKIAAEKEKRNIESINSNSIKK
jgi:hypothetical protein